MKVGVVLTPHNGSSGLVVHKVLSSPAHVTGLLGGVMLLSYHRRLRMSHRNARATRGRQTS